MALKHFKHIFPIGCLLFAATTPLQVASFDNSRSDNLVVYYGQNSGGATHAANSYSQKTLSAYCQDDTVNVIPLAFLYIFFSTGGLPEIDLASTCNSGNGNVFPGTRLAKCPGLEDDIKTCQARGKIVTISLGGATGVAGFTSNAQARKFAETVWDLFLGGSSKTRPFGNAVLDGVDLDIESGSDIGMAAFVTKIRELSQGQNKRYYVTAAPQCPFPDAYLGSVISAVGFDSIYVQYNNYCGVNNYNDPNAWNFGVWDTWAKRNSPNKNVKVYIGAPGAVAAAGTGYVSASTLGKIAKATRAKYSSFGGVMLWDASQAYGNGRYDVAVKNAIGAGGSTSTFDERDADEECPDELTTTTTKQPTTTTTKSMTTTKKTTAKTTTTSRNATNTTSKATLVPSTTIPTTSKHLITTLTSPTTPTTMTTTPTTTPSIPSPTPVPTSGGCQGVASWDASTVYVGSNTVTYDGHLWTAKWWTLGDTPGGEANIWAAVWADIGACTSAGGISSTSNLSSPQSPTPTSDNLCANIATWSPETIYVGGKKAVYGGHLWTAQWWTQGDTPGAPLEGGEVWTDVGICASTNQRRRRSRVFRY